MRLVSSGGMSFEMAIVGYQFPSIEFDEYGFDSNWLMIQIQVSHPLGNWTYTGPDLLTYEVEQLCDWLERIHRGETVEPEMIFTEPNLEFYLIESKQHAARLLRICFQLEARPPWAPSNVAGKCEVWVEFPLNEVDLAAAARNLRLQYQRFPRRGAI